MLKEAPFRTPSPLEAVKPAETPSQVETISLPNIQVGESLIRLGMHTDTLGTLVKTLSALPDLSEMKIEGRVLTKDQTAALEAHPVYNFYLMGRLARVNTAEGISTVFALPEETRVSQEKAEELLQTPFTPSVLADEIGFKTGFFNASDIISYWSNSGLINDFRPMLGGINEFRIGSDTLSPSRLVEIAGLLNAAFYTQENPVMTLSPNMASNFNIFNLNTITLKNSDDLLIKKIKNNGDLFEKKKEIISFVDKFEGFNLKNSFRDWEKKREKDPFLRLGDNLSESRFPTAIPDGYRKRSSTPVDLLADMGSSPRRNMPVSSRLDDLLLRSETEMLTRRENEELDRLYSDLRGITEDKRTRERRDQEEVRAMTETAAERARRQRKEDALKMEIDSSKGKDTTLKKPYPKLY